MSLFWTSIRTGVSAQLAQNGTLPPVISAETLKAGAGAELLPTSRLAVPVLTLHNVADGLFPVEHERAYASVVQAAGKEALDQDMILGTPLIIAHSGLPLPARP